jgi:serine-type D-Ala-D-Ala carboxypeptidase (penicillin-binding protein 5/6)
MLRFLIAFFLFWPLSLFAETEITARSYLLMEKNTLTVIAGKDYHRELPPASTTKVMTTILALEKLSDDETIVPTKKVLSLPHSKLNLFPGRTYRASDLIRGAMVESANDAAFALAIRMAGDESSFAEMMNEKALEIGARNTNFKNASGLFTPGQHTSCYDLAMMFRYALSNEKFREIVSTKYFAFNTGNRDVQYKNHNRFLFCFEPALGGKTGFTRASQHTYVGAFQKDGNVYILSMLGSGNLWGDAVNILSQVYDELPSKRELYLAKAGHISLSSYVVKSPKAKKGKATAAKKKAKKGKKKGNIKVQRA